MTIDSTPAGKLADGLLQWVSDDAMLGSDRTMTYAEARTRFGIPGTNIGMGNVLDDAYRLLLPELGDAVALGVVAYVVNRDTGMPGGGWDEQVNGGKKAAQHSTR